MPTEPLRRERIPTAEGFALHATVSGTGERVLLGLHGGPGGAGGDYLEPLHRLSGRDRRVVTFDQLGTGESTTPPAGYAWSVAGAVADVDAVRGATGADRIDLLGHSWGGMLALQYALDHPDRIGRLVLSNTTASSARITVDALAQLSAALPVADASAAITADVNREHDSPVFRAAVAKWLAHYATDDAGDLPALLDEALDPGPAGRGLWGDRLWFADGALRGWDVEDRLPEIVAPTLVLHGGADMSSAGTNRVLARRIAGAEWLTLQNYGHSMFEDINVVVYLAIIREFLDGWERQ